MGEGKDRAEGQDLSEREVGCSRVAADLASHSSCPGRLHIGTKPKPAVVKPPALNYGKTIIKHHPDIKVLNAEC